MENSNTERVLFFSPFAGIWPHALAERQLIDQIQKIGYKVTVIGCNKLFDNHCTVMESWKTQLTDSIDAKLKCCNRCRFSSKLLFNQQNIEYLNLNDYITRDEILNIHDRLHSLSSKELKSTNFNGINIGVNALYEPLLKFKQLNSDFYGDRLDYYRNAVFNAYVTAVAATRFCAGRQYKFVFIYSPQYGINNSFAGAVQSISEKIYLIEGSANLNETYTALRIWNWNKFGLVNPALYAWESGKNLNISRDHLARGLMHYRELWNGKNFTYSPKYSKKSEFQKILGIQKNQKIWLMALSSFDEAYAAYGINAFPKSKFESKVFENQFEWVRETIKWFRINNPPNTTLVIRMHPRDLPNRRESIESQQHKRWVELLQNLPENVFVDTPEMKISFRSYLNEIKLLITGWSSVALDSLLNSIPVLTYDSNLPSFPKDIHVTGDTRDEYFSNLNSFLNDRQPEVDINLVKKWVAFNFAYGVVRHPGRIQDLSILRKFKTAKLFFSFTSKYIYKVMYKLDLKLSRSGKYSNKNLVKLLNSRADSLFDLSKN